MRDGSRYEIDASCRFWWITLVDQAHFGSGRISDLSVAGVSVSTPILPLVGSSIMLEIDLPRSSRVGRPGGSYLLLAAEGRVLRHHPQGGGFAARITHASFANTNEAISE
jgi:hypothetical protein